MAQPSKDALQHATDFIASRDALLITEPRGSKRRLAQEILDTQMTHLSCATTYALLAARTPTQAARYVSSRRSFDDVLTAIKHIKRLRDNRIIEPALREAPSTPLPAADDRTAKWLEMFTQRTGRQIHEYVAEFEADGVLLTVRPVPQVGETWVEIPHGRTAFITESGAFLLTGSKAGQKVEMTGAWKPYKKAVN